MSNSLVASSVNVSDLRATYRHLVLRRENGTSLVFDAEIESQTYGREGELRLPWSDFEYATAAYPWPSLEVRWRERSAGRATTHTDIFRPADARHDAHFAEAIRRVIDVIEEVGCNVERGWLNLHGSGGKPIRECVGVPVVNDGQAQIAARVIAHWRTQVARRDAPQTDLLSMSNDLILHSPSSTRIAWDQKNIVFGTSGDTTMDASGFSFAIEDIVKLELFEPWPRVAVTYEFNRQTSTERFIAQPGDELAFEAAIERIAALLEHRAPARLDAGWREVPHAYFELVAAMPTVETRDSGGGAFRTSAERELDPILVSYRREDPGFLERVFGSELGPFQIVVTASYVYAELDRNLIARIPLASARFSVRVEDEIYFIFGRATPLRIPDGERNPVLALLAQHSQKAHLI